MLALQSPVASDLRQVVAALRIIAEIERSADLAVNICKAARRIYGHHLDPRLRGIIQKMGDAGPAAVQRGDRGVPDERRQQGGRARRHGQLPRRPAAAVRAGDLREPLGREASTCRSPCSSPSSPASTSASATTPSTSASASASSSPAGCPSTTAPSLRQPRRGERPGLTSASRGATVVTALVAVLGVVAGAVVAMAGWPHRRFVAQRRRRRPSRPSIAATRRCRRRCSARGPTSSTAWPSASSSLGASGRVHYRNRAAKAMSPARTSACSSTRRSTDQLTRGSHRRGDAADARAVRPAPAPSSSPPHRCRRWGAWRRSRTSASGAASTPCAPTSSPTSATS